MGNTNNKSGVLVGQLHSYCAACELVAKNDEFEGHLLSEAHKSRIANCSLVEGYKLENIRRVPKGYLCERCNCLFRSISKVEVHVSTPSHTTRHLTETPPVDIKQNLEGIVAFNCLKVEELAWNAIVKGACLVCDVDVLDVQAHSVDDGHVINLIQAPVVKKYYYLYRKVDTSVQCLTCNILISETELDNHFESLDHETIFFRACNGRIFKRKTPNYNVDQGLKIKNFFSPNNHQHGLCLLCNWFVEESKINDHLNGYHHQSLLKLHNKWIYDKKAERQFFTTDDKKITDDIIKREKVNNKLVTQNTEPNPEVKADDDLSDGISSNYKTETSANNENIDLNNVKPNFDSINDNNKDVGEPINAICKTEIIEDPKTEETDKNGETNGHPKNNGESSADKSDPPEKDTPAKIQKSSKKKGKAQKEYKINTSISNNIVIRKNVEIAPAAVDEPSKEEIEKAKALADEYDVKIKPDGVATCNVCNTNIGGQLEDIEVHISSIKHKKKFFKSSKISPNNYDVMRMADYHKRSLMTYNIIRSFMVVNGEFCVHLLSYQVFVETPEGLQCFLCNKAVEDGQQHFLLDLHKRLWGNCLVITSFQHEFVREVKKGVFHCGFCNAIFKEWDTLLLHLMSRSHGKFKMAADMAGGLQMRMLFQNQMMGAMRAFM